MNLDSKLVVAKVAKEFGIATYLDFRLLDNPASFRSFFLLSNSSSWAFKTWSFNLLVGSLLRKDNIFVAKKKKSRQCFLTLSFVSLNVVDVYIFLKTSHSKVDPKRYSEIRLTRPTSKTRSTLSESWGKANKLCFADLSIRVALK